MLCEVFSLCYVRFWTRRELAPLASGRFAAAAAASRPQAISPNIIVFVVRGLTFVNVSALDVHPVNYQKAMGSKSN